jgi:predicted HTH domain antitoxin
MTITIPDDILKRAGVTERDILVELACRLFDAEKLSKAEASALCGLDRPGFENELYKRRLPLFHTSLEDYEIDRTGKKAG